MQDPMLNLIAELKQILYETKIRLYEPLSKLELVTERLAPLQEKFGHELVSFWFFIIHFED